MNHLAYCFGLLLSLSTGCIFLEEEDPFGSDEPVGRWQEGQLAHVPSLTVDVLVAQPLDSPAATTVEMTLVYANKPTSLADESPCLVFSRLRVALDGVTSQHVVRGGWNGQACEAPTVRISVPSSTTATSSLTIADDTRSIVVPLGDLLVPRTQALRSPPAAGYRTGDAVSVAWSHPADLALAKPSVALDAGRAGSGNSVPVPEVTLSADTFGFPMPRVSPGPFALIAAWSHTLLRCDGICAIKVQRSLTVGLTAAGS